MWHGISICIVKNINTMFLQIEQKNSYKGLQHSTYFCIDSYMAEKHFSYDTDVLIPPANCSQHHLTILWA